MDEDASPQFSTNSSVPRHYLLSMKGKKVLEYLPLTDEEYYKLKKQVM